MAEVIVLGAVVVVDCVVCQEPVQQGECLPLAECHDACGDQNLAHLRCLLLWFAASKKAGRPFCCPSCQAVVSTFKEGSESIDQVVAAEKTAEELLHAYGGGGAAPLAAMEQQDDGKVYDINYIAGVKKVAHNSFAFKVVWCPRDVRPGEPHYSWETLDGLTEWHSKVCALFARWHLPRREDLPVGFQWHHPVPKWCKQQKVWVCNRVSCGHVFKKMTDCRRHAGTKCCWPRHVRVH